MPAASEGSLHALRLHATHDDEPTFIALAADGDVEAREWLVRRWTPSMYRFALRMLSDDQEARDAAQDTMIKVLRHLDRYDQTRSFGTWVFGIARNTCIDEHRRRRRRGLDPAPDVADVRPGPLQKVSRQQRAQRVHEALQLVPPTYREVLVRYHFEHLKYTEIAEALGIPLGPVMNRIFGARGKLRDACEILGKAP